MQRIFILTFFLFACGTASNITTTNPIVEENKDVVILSSLIHDHLKRTNGRDLILNELIQYDTLRRISNNFEKLEFKSHAGYISVCYKLSVSRNNKVELTGKERDLANVVRWSAKASKLTSPYDGEIRFDYGERFYRIRQIIVNNE